MPRWPSSAPPIASNVRKTRRWPPRAASQSGWRARCQNARAGIGVAAGQVVAGNVGAKERFEYTVVGEPVNEAARLSELAKSQPKRLLASSETVDGASEDERAHWSMGETVTLRADRSRRRSAR